MINRRQSREKMLVKRKMCPDESIVFGPVPSRRLGRSLGIDILPFKTCTYDCIYCQIGRTIDRTLQCHRYVTVSKVVKAVASAVEKTEIDYLTLSGSGEPTLNSDMGDIVDSLKREFHIPVAVLTNGSLLYQPEVREALLSADVVMPTLAADSSRLFRTVHRPHPDLTFDNVLQGIMKFGLEFKNHLWLEVFLLEGINADDKTVESLVSLVDSIAPEKVHVNTVDRPAAETYARAVEPDRLSLLIQKFGSATEAISDFKRNSSRKMSSNDTTVNEVLALLQRRPCTAADISESLMLHRVETLKVLTKLHHDGILEIEHKGNKDYYRIENLPW